MTLKTLTALGIMLALAAPVFAQDQTGANVEDVASGQPGGVAQFDMALGLYALGLAQKDALLMLTAAKLAAGVQMVDVVREGAQTAVAPDSGPVDAAAMLVSARDFAADDESLLVLIEEVERGGLTTGGASRQRNHVAAGAAQTWKIPFYSGSLAEVGVGVGVAGTAALVVAISDENGNPVACPVRGPDRFYCAFVPRWNGYFEVTVTNTGTEANTYDLLTN